MNIDDAIAGSLGDLVWSANAALRVTELVGGAALDPTVRDHLVAADSILDWVGDEAAAVFASRETLRDHFVSLPKGFQTVTILASPIFEGDQFLGYTGILRASELMSDQAARLKTVQAQRDLFQSALEASPINVTIADMSHPTEPLIYVNQAFCETTGYDREESVGRNCRFLQGRETDPAAVRRIRDALKEEKPLDIELLNYRKDGTPFWNALSIAPVYNDMGDVIASLGIQRDVTAERAVQQEELTRQRLESLGRLAGGFAGRIEGLVTPLLDEVKASNSSRSDIDRRTAAFQTLIKDMKSIAGVGKENLSPIDLCSALQDVSEVVQEILPQGVTIDLRLPTDLENFPCLVRQEDLREILLGLCFNSSQAMRNLGTITISVGFTQERALIDVIDSGPGIPAEILDKIFDPFFTSWSEQSGSGLGLSVVHAVITSLRGSIEVHSTGPLGTTFRVTLWRSEAG